MPPDSHHLEASSDQPIRTFPGLRHIAGAISLVFLTTEVATDVVGAGAGAITGVVGLGTIVFAAAAIGLADHIERGAARCEGAAMRGAARLLPAHTRQDCAEEWQAWLIDLREDGIPWYRRLFEGLTIALIAAPRLAVRWRRHGAGD